MGLYHSEMLAVSLAGHDKGKIYVVLERQENTCSLVNGETKLLGRPKRKNQKHIQLIRNIPANLLADMDKIRDDADVRRILKAYKNLKSKEVHACQKQMSLR
ncbi:MAG: KOW domain-containing RNA-binding protein [Lachnospiraceae bacterium]|nr:KOW domain-containing RNA-binding protein [Lachnospiraceae bacterium]